MKSTVSSLVMACLFFCITLPGYSQEMDSLKFERLLDSIRNSFNYTTTGQVSLAYDVATLQIPPGFKFLEQEQARIVIEDLWGNPPDPEIYGMLFPQQFTPVDSNAWAFVISYSTLGYIKDKDADKMNYKKLLQQIQDEAAESNKMRTEMGYETVEILGWASEPYYDKVNKTLHWAKEIKFGDYPDDPHTLNYDLRILGRKGVLSYNAVGNMDMLNEIQKSIPSITASSAFTDGNKYSDFNPKIDQVAAVGIGGLIAGKVLAKAGFFALLVKFWKFIAIGLLAFGGTIWRFISGKKKEPEFEATTESTEVMISDNDITDASSEIPPTDTESEEPADTQPKTE